MIGFYDYTVWLTYISLAVSVFGIFGSAAGDVKTGIICLALSGFLDTFDGAVARTKKNRTDRQKAFGIEIDSLSDLVCFGIGPVMIARAEGVSGWFGTAVLMIYGVAGLIRLAYFNVTEAERQKSTAEKRKYYQGLPITAASFFVPLYYLLSLIFGFEGIAAGWLILMLIMGILFIADIRIRKPSVKQVMLTAAAAALLLAGIYALTR